MVGGAKDSVRVGMTGPVLGFWKQAKRREEVGDLYSGPKHISAARCSAQSIAGCQFQVSNFPPSQGLIYELPWDGSCPEKLDRGLFHSFGNLETKKILQMARKNLKLMKSYSGAFCVYGSALYKYKNDY